MSKETGGSAFPTDKFMDDGSILISTPGMTLRDYFAAQAMAALIAGDATGSAVEADMWAPSHAYEIADAMLAERAK